MPKCNQCPFQGEPQEFKPCFSPYHDFYCPECGTSDVDTKDINEAWAKDGNEYGYGDNNFLIMN